MGRVDLGAHDAKRRVENDALDVRVVAVVRKAMLLPAGKPDAVTEVLSWTYADAFRDADLAWMAENIAALDAAGPGRWTKIMTMLVAASRRKLELDHLIVIGGIALTQSRRVHTSAIRAWMQKRGHNADAWMVALESALDKNRGSSGFRVARIEGQTAAVEQDSGAEVLEAAIAEGALLEHLDHRVDGLAAGVGDAVLEVGQHVR